jgi:hypothetical protein
LKKVIKTSFSKANSQSSNLDTASVANSRKSQSKEPTVILKIINDGKSEATIESARSTSKISRSRKSFPKTAKRGEDVKVFEVNYRLKYTMRKLFQPGRLYEMKRYTIL